MPMSTGNAASITVPLEAVSPLRVLSIQWASPKARPHSSINSPATLYTVPGLKSRTR